MSVRLTVLVAYLVARSKWCGAGDDLDAKSSMSLIGWPSLEHCDTPLGL